MPVYKKILFVGLVIITLIAVLNSVKTQANMSLKKGNKIPNFTLKDQDNKDFSIDNYIGNPMVIYFYPKDDTPGCIKEACSFRDQYEAFINKNVLVVGISSDSVVSHKKFSNKYNLPFKLLADTNKEVRKAFGVKKSTLGLIPGRVTFIVDSKGIIQYVFESQFKAEKHIEKALEIIKKL